MIVILCVCRTKSATSLHLHQRPSLRLTSAPPTWTGDTSVDAHDQDSTHPNVVLSMEDALLRHMRPVRGCTGCLKRKIKCDRAKPECDNCARIGRECSFNVCDESLKLTEEVRKPEQAHSLEHGKSLNDEDPKHSFSSPASPTSSDYASQPIQAIPGLAHNVSLSNQYRKNLREWGLQHAGQSQLTDGLSSGTGPQPLRSYGATPLRSLLGKYYLLDAIAQIKPENVNSCLDVVHTEPPIRPLAESVDRLYAMPPKPWLAIRRMIRNLYTDVLYDILDIISEAKLYTDYVLFHTSSRPTLGPIEQKFACPALFDCVRVRQYMLNMLFREIQAFILKLRRPQIESGKEGYRYAPPLSAPQSSAKPVTVEERMIQASRNSKRLLQIISRRIWDRILHPKVQGKPRNRAVDGLMLTESSDLYCDDLQQTLRVTAIYTLPLILSTNSTRIFCV